MQMTENGELENVALNDEQLDKVAEIMEKRVTAEANAEFAKMLKPEQVEALIKAGFKNKEKIRAASDEDLVAVKGIGIAAAQVLRDWATGGVKKGDAIATRYLVLKNGAEKLNVVPGQVIPAEFGAEEAVKKGQAYWGA